MTQQAVKKDEYKKVSRFGVAPLQKNGVHSEQGLMDLFSKQYEAVAVTFNGQDALIQFFLGQMFGVAIRYQELPRGSRFLSMTYFWNGKIMDTGKWEWVGDKPFNAYVLGIDYEMKRYWIVVPETCGNICLWKIEAIEPEQPKIKQFPSRLSGLGTEIVQEQKPKPIVEPIQRGSNMDYFFDLGGGIFKSCYKEYVTMRIGLRATVNDKLELNFLGGMNLPIDIQKDSGTGWKMVFTGDVGLIYRPSALFVGAGVGMSSKMKDGIENQFEGIFVLGHQFNKVDLFLEARVPLKKGENINKNNKILIGLRVYL
ncbi:MAG: hypothetical protein Q8N88_03920 [Nanoarchaeota archaeon]|nr:hypothetical protein [Nanoarchaeota archaeon]